MFPMKFSIFAFEKISVLYMGMFSDGKCTRSGINALNSLCISRFAYETAHLISR